MKRFSGQYLFTNSGTVLKRAVISTEDDGTILNIEDTGGDLKEKHSVEFHNGIIIPGFVNCHCHIELSHMKDSIGKAGGLGGFIADVNNTRRANNETITDFAESADEEMYREGIVLCADICNTSLTFKMKKRSRIRYFNLLEVFGNDPKKAKSRLDEITKIAETASEMSLPFSIVPHSAYSMSLTLFRLLKEQTGGNKITSIHFMESADEKPFLNDHSGPLMSSFEKAALLPGGLETVKNHTDAVLNEITQSGNMILVHNTFVDKEIVGAVKERKKLYWCLCPNSNIYIENKVPPLNLLVEEGCEIVIGTDSLASNNRLSIIEELKTLQLKFPEVSMEDLVRWATLNGAKALGEDDKYGKIEIGKRPGLLLIQNVDLQNMKLLHDSFVTRLI
ncbi:MAG TPA: amidohydrolase family protein [Bacteroidales bacterium]